MKITHLTSATEIISVDGVKILTDPWLDDGIYYGSWYLYPPYKENNELLQDIDYVYVSHIHPDHFCEKSMQRLNKSTEVLIHHYDEKFLKRKLEMLGFSKITELPNNKRTLLKNNVHINIVAADNCNPEICGKIFGCASYTGKSEGSNQIDSMCVIDNGEYVLLNTNDCPYPIAYEALDRIIEQYPKIDFLLVGYTGASLYPFAMSECYSREEMVNAQMRVRKRSLDMGAKIVEKIKPRYFMPFAGTYVLGGRNWELNQYSPMPELQDAADYIREKDKIRNADVRSVLLNSGETFDLATETQTQSYRPVNKVERQQYITDVLSKIPHHFESDPEVTLSDFEALLPAAVERFNAKTQNLQFTSETAILIALPDAKMLEVNCSEFPTQANVVKNIPDNYREPYVYFYVDPKLLLQVFKGPRYAHWNNIEIGALLKMERKPDVYEMGIHLALCYLHA